MLHADETPVQMLKPGNGKTHRAYLWAYAPGRLRPSRPWSTTSASRARASTPGLPGDWRGSLTCDDFSGYKALIASGVTEVGCLAHARRKFFDLHAANQSQIAEFALQQFARVYGSSGRPRSQARPEQGTCAAADPPVLDACMNG